MEESKKYWLGFAWFDAFSAMSLWRIWEHVRGDGLRAWSLRRKEFKRFGARYETTEKFFAWKKNIDLGACVRRCEAEGVRFILPSDEEYPPLLKEISDPPLGLFIRGQPLKDEFMLGVVGTRACTPYGKRATHEIVSTIAANGIPIVSGLALGIDSIAHQAALSSGGVTVAVLGGGINDDAVYPRQHLPLAHQILKQQGSIVGEFPPGAESKKYHFPLRNRIIAGLSRGILVSEAAEKSGSLITARLALEENRDVFALPGPITSKVSAGTHLLLKNGAVLCTSPEDILNHFHVTRERDPPRNIGVSEQEKEVLDLLDRPLHADDLVRHLGIKSAELGGILVQLEMKKLIAQEEPDVYSLAISRKRLEQLKN